MAQISDACTCMEHQLLLKLPGNRFAYVIDSIGVMNTWCIIQVLFLPSMYATPERAWWAHLAMALQSPDGYAFDAAMCFVPHTHPDWVTFASLVGWMSSSLNLNCASLLPCRRYKSTCSLGIVTMNSRGLGDVAPNAPAQHTTRFASTMSCVVFTHGYLNSIEFMGCSMLV